MKRKGFFLTGLFCLFCALAALTSCNKNSECIGKVYTYVTENGIEVPIGGCELIFGDKATFAPEIYREAVTDESGRYEGTWNREVNLFVEAKKPFNSEQYYYGYGYIYLEPGNTTELSLPLELRRY